MPTIETGVEDSELKQLIKDMSLVDKAMAFNALQTLKAVSFAVEKDVKQRMPVDTGRARASWGHWSMGGLKKTTAGTLTVGGKVFKIKVAKNEQASQADAIWEDNGTSIKQGSNVEYIEYLNNGHSKQAPAGFIDRAQVRGEVALDLALGKIDIASPNALSMTFSPSTVGYSEE